MKNPTLSTLFARALALLIASGCWTAAQAQNLYLKDGQVIAAKGVRREGSTVFTRIQTDGTQGESGYPVANIARIDFPEPAQLKLATEALNAGRAEEAVRQITPLLAYYAPFYDVPGNWWTPLALLQTDALTRLGRDREAEAVVSEIIRFGGNNPDVLRAVKIKQAEAVDRQGDHHKALEMLAPVVGDLALPPSSLVEAWLTVGSAHLALREYKDALLAFLHVPVYAPDKASLMPPALLGSASAYAGLDDVPRAQNVLKELLASYPTSPEAAQAKERLQKLVARPPKPAGG